MKNINSDPVFLELLAVVKEIKELESQLGNGCERISSLNNLIKHINIINFCNKQPNSEITPEAYVQYYKSSKEMTQPHSNMILENITFISQKLIPFLQDAIKNLSSSDKDFDSKRIEIKAGNELTKSLGKFNAIIERNKSLIFKTVEGLKISETIGLPKWYYKINWNTLPKVKLVVADTFEINTGQVTNLLLNNLNDHLDPDCINEGYGPSIISDKKIQTHGIEVAGIITKFLPNVQLIPKKFFSHDYYGNMKELYGAKVINLSSMLMVDSNEDEANLVKDIIELAKDHIIVKSLGNHSNTLLNREPFFSKILENIDVRKHMIFVANVLPGGNEIHPSSGIPGSYELVQGMTVAAPGWINVVTIDQQKAEGNSTLSLNNLKFIEEDYSCTSYATPLVSALVGLLMLLFPKFKLEVIVDLVKFGAVPVGDKAIFGCGAINFNKTLKEAQDNYAVCCDNAQSVLAGLLIEDYE